MTTRELLFEELFLQRNDISTEELKAIGNLIEIADNRGIARLGRQEINLFEVLGLNLTNAQR